jgi:transmembrane sensor
MSRFLSQPEIDAQAAVWLAALGDETDLEVRSALDAWIAEDEAHAEAFRRASEVWAILPRATAHAPDTSSAPVLPIRRGWPVGLAAAACVSVLLGMGVLTWSWREAGTYATRLGEQRVATLQDGSRLALNTDTRVDVRFDADRRRISLDHGEAMFEVAHDASRPFVVVAGDTTIRAIGTVFTVRRTRDDVVVTLIKGRVAVSSDRPRVGDAAGAVVMLEPGEKLIEPMLGSARVELESIEAATAWRRGQAVFDDTPLGTAIAELNRYGGPQIVIDDPRIAALPVSGVFAANAADFAEAAATLHGLKVEKKGKSVRITR